MTENMKAILLGLGVLVALLALLVTQYEDSGPAIGSAPPGLPATMATSGVFTVGPLNAVSVFEFRTNCAARTISTQAQSIKISFGSTTPTELIGYNQTASTSAVYDTGLFGCGNWRIFGNAASTSITVEESF